MSNSPLANEALLLGLLLTVFGAAGCVMARNELVGKTSWLILVHGFALASLAASTSWGNSAGEILAACVLILGTLLSLTDGRSRSAQREHLNGESASSERIVS